MPAVTAYQSRYSGKLYSTESACIQNEFYHVRDKAQTDLSAFLLHSHAMRRNDDKFTDLWRTLRTLRELDAAFYEALGRERLARAENVVEMIRTSPEPSAPAPAEEHATPAPEAAANAV